MLGCTQEPVKQPASNNTNTSERTTVSKPAVTGGETGNPVTQPNTTDKPSTTATKPSPTKPANNEALRPDNTAINERDAEGAKPTPENQSNAQKDLDTTAEIRKKILDLKGLSISARNVKIITEAGKVTLRGPVASEAERKQVEQIARDVAGKENVTSELEIAP